MPRWFGADTSSGRPCRHPNDAVEPSTFRGLPVLADEWYVASPHSGTGRPAALRVASRGPRTRRWQCFVRLRRPRSAPLAWLHSEFAGARFGGSSSSTLTASGSPKWTACTRSGGCRSPWATFSPRPRSATPARLRTSSGRTRTKGPRSQHPCRAGDRNRSISRRHRPEVAPTSRSVSRVLYRGAEAPRRRSSISGRRLPDGSCGRPEGTAARRSARRTGPSPSYLALLRVEFAPFHPADRQADQRTRLCGTGPRLTADGRYPLPCAGELGLSSGRTVAGRPATIRSARWPGKSSPHACSSPRPRARQGQPAPLPVQPAPRPVAASWTSRVRDAPGASSPRGG